MVVARSHGIAQRGKPGALDEASVERELGARDAPGIEHVEIVGVACEFRIFKLFGLVDELLDAFFLGGIGGTVGITNEAVVGVLAGVDRAHAIEFADQDRGKEMVQGESVIGVAGNDSLKVLNGSVVVEVVIVLDGGLVKRIGGTKRAEDSTARGLANPSRGDQA